ncbi:MAG: hypothetical protein AAGI27_04660 [Pseudomonadota bacterium]
MKHIVAPLLLAGGAMFLLAPAAEAHHHRHGDYAHHGHHQHHYRGHMPRWMQRERRFRSWYRHTRLKYNPRLDWWELYDIYRWERRYAKHQRYHRYKHTTDRDYGYYRRYWNERPGKRYGHHRDHYGKRHAYRDDHRDKYHDRRRRRD